MVEKCARIIGAIYDGDVDPVATPNRWPIAESAARAVIEALMTPTPEMLAHAEIGYITSMLEVEHNMEVALGVYVSMLRTSISQPNDEGEGK